MTKTTSFQTNIRPLFTERDIQGMSKAFNLGSHDDVKKHVGVIYDRRALRADFVNGGATWGTVFVMSNVSKGAIHGR